MYSSPGVSMAPPGATTREPAANFAPTTAGVTTASGGVPSWVWLAAALWVVKAAAGGYVFHRYRTR